MFWNDGSIYKGFWSEGQQHGIGIMIFNSGQRVIGIFHNNIFN
jgi:hypothetical protein